MKWVAAVLFATTVAHGAARADDHYLAVFSAETFPYIPEKTHSFAAAVRVPTTGPVEVASISWLPASLDPRGLTLLPERGVNLGIPETVAWAKKLGMRVSVWGPYRIDKELFRLLKDHAATLDAGRVRYKPTDNLYCAFRVHNCYHALWMPVAPVRARGFAGPFSAGDTASGATVRLYSPWILDPCRTHDEVLGLIGVCGESLCRRAFDDRPTRRDAIRSMLGR